MLRLCPSRQSKAWEQRQQFPTFLDGHCIEAKRRGAEIVKLERLSLALWPRPQVVREFLVAADGWPVHVVRNGIAIQKIYRRSLYNGRYLRHKGHLPLINRHVLRRRIKLLSGYRIHVHNNVSGQLQALYRHLAFHITSLCYAGQGKGG